jgi:hypothetical protein
VHLSVQEWRPFIGGRDRERGWPGRARDMAMTRPAVISSGRDCRGSMGGVCRWWGDVGGALALQGGDGRDGEQWHLRTWSGNFFSSGSWGSAQRESGYGGIVGECCGGRIGQRMGSQRCRDALHK